MTAAERVARGAALLDEKRPGWAAEIDLSLLDLASGCRCVLGQLWDGGGNFDDEPYLLGIEDLGIYGEGADYGFSTGSAYPTKYAELDELWIAEIRRRLDAPAPATP